MVTSTPRPDRRARLEARMADDVTKPEQPQPDPSGAQPAPATPPVETPAPADAAVVAGEALEAAQTAVTSLETEVGKGGLVGGGAATMVPGATPEPFAMESFGRPDGETPAKSIDLLSDVNLNVKIELGRTRMLVED